MKKRSIHYQTYNPKKRKLLSSILFFSFLLIVVIIALYLSFQPREIQLSPDKGLGSDNAKSILSAMGIKQDKNLQAWFCGKMPTYTDKKGNTYTVTQLAELKKALGNEKLLNKEFCGTTSGCISLKGDANGDGKVTIPDVIYINNYLKKRGPMKCTTNADFNGNGKIDTADSKALAEYLFGKQTTPPTTRTQPTPTPTQPTTTVTNCLSLKGDANGDKKVDISDVIYINNYLTQKGPMACKANADFDGDGDVDKTDAELLTKEKFGT